MDSNKVQLMKKLQARIFEEMKEEFELRCQLELIEAKLLVCKSNKESLVKDLIELTES